MLYDITFKEPITREQSIEEWSVMLMQMFNAVGPTISEDALKQYARWQAEEITEALGRAMTQLGFNVVEPEPSLEEPILTPEHQMWLDRLESEQKSRAEEQERFMWGLRLNQQINDEKTASLLALAKVEEDENRRLRWIVIALIVIAATVFLLWFRATQ